MRLISINRPTAIFVTVFLAMAVGVFMLVPGGDAVAAQNSAPTGQDSTNDLVCAVKGLESKLGFHRTRSFEHQSGKAAVDYRCYYTGKLKLPDDYQGLRLKRGNPKGCKLNPNKYDVFYYPLQAMGSPKSQVTTSLAEASPERVLMVIPHEDFHQDPALRGLPDPLAEAAATLVGFLTARDVARQQFGPESEVYKNLEKEAGLFYVKSGVVNRYFDQVRELYAQYGAKQISKADALAAKTRLFSSLEQACGTIEPSPKSFNRCPAANNNAGLAFDHTYTLYYPLMHAVAEAHGGDLKATIDALRSAMAGKSGPEAIESLRAIGQSRQVESPAGSRGSM